MKLTPDKLRALAAQERKRAEALTQQAREAEGKALVYEKTASELDKLAGSLPSSQHKSTLDASMVDSHRLAIADGRTHGRSKNHPLRVATKAAGHTFRSLAKAIGIDASYLTLLVNGKRKASPEVRARIEKLTGFRLPE